MKLSMSATVVRTCLQNIHVRWFKTSTGCNKQPLLGMLVSALAIKILLVLGAVERESVYLDSSPPCGTPPDVPIAFQYG